jgi:CBS domain containing-hemolysin-like protein
MIHSVFELGDTFAREVMVPRPDIVFIERDKTIKQALTLALRSGFSRIPVIGENADDILGVAYLKDLVRRTQDGKDQLDVVTRCDRDVRPRLQAGRRAAQGDAGQPGARCRR